MKGKILVIEDEQAINDLICMNLEAAGYETDAYMDGIQVENELNGGLSGDLALLDVMLPGKDGFALLPLFREAGIPVIFLTARGDLTSKVRGLKEGAEDYLVKPFEMLELLVRIEKVLKRRGFQEDTCIVVRDVRIYPLQRRVTRGEKEVLLKPMEFDCLMMFVKYKNVAITREQLLRELWGVDFTGETRTIDVHVGRLRKKLDFYDVIRTVPRIGYRMEV